MCKKLESYSLLLEDILSSRNLNTKSLNSETSQELKHLILFLLNK